MENIYVQHLAWEKRQKTSKPWELGTHYGNGHGIMCGLMDSSNVIHEFSVGDTTHAQRKCIDAWKKPRYSVWIDSNYVIHHICLANVNVGRCAFEQAVNLDKSNGPAYILMENIYVQHLAWEKRQKASKPWELGTEHARSQGVLCGLTQVTLFIISFWLGIQHMHTVMQS